MLIAVRVVSSLGIFKSSIVGPIRSLPGCEIDISFTTSLIAVTDDAPPPLFKLIGIPTISTPAPPEIETLSPAFWLMAVDASKLIFPLLLFKSKSPSLVCIWSFSPA